jgi:hypothetical protein
MFTPRRHSIDSLLCGEKDQSPKVPNWTEKSGREVTTPVEAARVLFTECVGRDFGRERKDRPRVYRMFVIIFKCSIMNIIAFVGIFRLFCLLLGRGGERSSTTRMRLAGKICCFCGRYLDAMLWQLRIPVQWAADYGNDGPESERSDAGCFLPWRPGPHESRKA